MENINIEKPVPCPEAFYEPSKLGDYSRAAFLLSLGIMLNPSDDYKNDYLLEKHEDFSLPTIEKLSKLISKNQLKNLNSDSITGNEDSIDRESRNLIERIYYSSDNQLDALNLIALFIHHPNELLRVSAAISWLDAIYDSYLALEVLFEAIHSEYVLVREMAISALSRIFNEVGQFSNISKNTDSSKPPQVKDSGSFIVHGTIFSSVGKSYEKWWKPTSGDFHNYLKNGSRPNIYDAKDYFQWSGGWNDYARSQAAKELEVWINQHNMQNSDVFAHSHGCNVALLATQSQKLKKLILMSCPVHWKLYQPNFNNVDEVISIRVKFDFVIMADRGGQKFRDPRITETILPLWFTAHDASRTSKTWSKRKLDSLI
ncbi:HEAT repeat domain-containing protein [Shewanella polaris]|uniref:Alpha/beta hydrolase n=1 Tax=Shewanella polaris TaxID=2588449 RepID=A0A4Y5YCV4_9GAMM|nr:HEAT repeat domain-containing protein [Shewanella polaris]QDE30336.1 hypothetical protein FH971_04720 [Shewanella polaris]